MTIVWSPLAIERLVEAARYIARDKPETAERWAADAFAVVERLAGMPRSGRVVPELERDDVREVVYGAYRWIYRVVGEDVLILTVRHGRRRLDESDLEE